MQVVLADAYGMCFGVKDALSLAFRQPRPEQLTVLGELVHNPEVLDRLERAGVRRAEGVEAPVHTPRVMITAHGVAPSVRGSLAARGLEVLDGTCPLVTHAHRMLDRLVEQGYFPVIIGQERHVEVRGMTQDLAESVVVESAADLERLAGRAKLGVVSQTTQPPDYVDAMVERIRARFPDAEVQHCDTTCRPTRDRQAAARRLASECDTVVVVGGRGSNNTRQLVRTCELMGARAFHVERAADLDPSWLEGAERIGLTAGTSTPDETIQEVHAALLDLARSSLARAA